MSTDLTPLFGGNHVTQHGQRLTGAVARQTKRELEAIAARADIAAATEQVALVHAAVAMNNTLTLYRMTQAGLHDIPEAAPLVLPILSSYAQGAARRSQQY
ncbi:hypothetical protein LQ938_11460 [Microbacterium sp. cx-55]|uniref:hypothetical protein n=1 Tax=Microbacterium sp. cx-55 TaxID=2875948 RepID=UPI001CBDC24D|nr:hypothetical protein [Microbacterium sp. cx-55]MBZ4488107.1 hypothetical protein [Microbacterium sp. cx-55]UGB34484.1 hypothetical protein LQ938_11460 [Microbacterium sp. cx-55]